VRAPQGYAVWAGDRVTECDTFTCGHCQRVVFVPPKADPAELGGLCKQCMSLTCPRCTAAMRCLPFELALERAEASDRLRRSVL